MRILVIDDNEPLRKTLVAMLQGHDVVDVGDGDEGLAAVDGSSPFDLVITDVMMPNRAGVTTTIALKSRPNPPKVILISGSNNIANTSLAGLMSKVGADGWLLKPIRKAQLVAEITRVMG